MITNPWLAVAALGLAPVGARAVTETTSPFEVLRDADEELAALQKDFHEAYSAFREKVMATEDDEERQRVWTEEDPSASFAPRYLELAERHPKTDAAWQALTWVVSRGGAETQAKGLGILVADYIEDERLGDVCMRFVRSEPSEAISKAMKEVSARSPHDAVQGKATFALAMQHGARAQALEGDAKNKELAELERLMAIVQEKYADVDYFGRSTLGVKAKSTLFEIQRLQIGMVAPDIEAEDIDGVTFKLSDYRGKVVVLDFWGHW